MDIDDFQRANAIRAKRWHNDGDTQWNLLEWAGAMCGESGEAANTAKKIRRLAQKLPNLVAGLQDSDEPRLREKLATEVADSIIYGLIILSELDVDASDVIGDVFDKKSIEYGFPERAPR
jgi:NTP pyrophosphatase (non-canonical NTP hydrolase)